MKKIVDIVREKIKFNRINFQKITNDDLYNYSDTNKIISILKSHPVQLFEMLFPYVNKVKMIKKVDVNCDDLGDGTYSRYEVYNTINLNEFHKITNVNIYDTGIVKERGGEKDIEAYENVKIEFKEANYNVYSRQVELKGTYTGEGSSIYFLDNCDVGVELLVSGILEETEVPSWCEYLIEGLSNIQYENYKMAFFNTCAAFDNFINEIYDDIFHYYLEHYCETTNINIKNEDEEKIREFSNKEKRLRNKLFGILRELNINSKHGFSKIQSIVEIWDRKYVKERDKIAHGGKYDGIFEIEDVVYNIMTIILTILLNVDMCDTQWENLLE